VPGTHGLLVTAPEYEPKGWRGEISKDQKLDFKLEPALRPLASSALIRPYTPEDIRWP